MQTFKDSKQLQKEGKVSKPGQGSVKNRAKKWRQKRSRLAKEVREELISSLSKGWSFFSVH